MSVYLRTLEQALDALADVLDLEDRRERLIRSTVAIMLCLDVEPRALLVGGQTLFVQGGLDALRRKRRERIDSMGSPPPGAPDPASERAFEDVGRALDALRLAETARLILPVLRRERWQVARAILVNEAGVRRFLEEAVRGRGRPPVRSACEAALEEIVLSLHQPWMDRAGTLRTACLETLREARLAEPDRLHPEAELLFEVVATSDARATELLGAVDRSSGEAARQAARLHALASAVRSLDSETPLDPPGRAGLSGVA